MKLLHDSRFKLKEVEYFYQKIKEEKGLNIEHFIYNLSAFLCAWGSICCMKKHGKKKIFRDFINYEIDNILKNHRISSEGKRESIKQRILEKIYSTLTKKEKEIEKKLIYWRNCLVHKKYPPLDIDIIIEEGSEPFFEAFPKYRKKKEKKDPCEPFFEAFPSKDKRKKVLEICEEGLNLAKKFIEKCEELLKYELNKNEVIQ